MNAFTLLIHAALWDDSYTGNFSLNLSWKPLSGLLRGKLSFVELLAQKKAISMTIVDDTALCTEFPSHSLDHALVSDGGFLMRENGMTREDSESHLPLSPQRSLSIERIPGFSAQKARLEDSCLHVDVGRVCQVIQNLVTNAVRVTPANGAIQVRISVVQGVRNSAENIFWDEVTSPKRKRRQSSMAMVEDRMP